MSESKRWLNLSIFSSFLFAVWVNRAVWASTCFRVLEKWTFPEKSMTFDPSIAGRGCQQAYALLCGQLPFNPIIVTRQLLPRPKLGFRKSLLNNQINAHAENLLCLRHSNGACKAVISDLLVGLDTFEKTQNTDEKYLGVNESEMYILKKEILNVLLFQPQQS